MEWTGKKKRLEEAKTNSEKIKLIFQYPSSPRAIIKSGMIIECYDDGFLIDEKIDGMVVYSYEFLIEIKGVRQNDM